MAHGLSIIPIPAANFEHWRPKLQCYFDNFVARSGGSLHPDKLVSGIRESNVQCWAVIDQNGDVLACALTNILDDKTNTCIITHCAGSNYKHWCGELLATIYAWSSSLGSTKLEAITRPGWERVLKPYGMRKTHVVLELMNDG